MNQDEFTEKMILAQLKDQLERDRDQYIYSLDKAKESVEEWELRVQRVDCKLESINNIINKLK